MAVIITRLHNNLPDNRKSREVSAFLRRLVHTTFTGEEFAQFIDDLTELVEALNAKYRTTKPYYVTGSPGDNSVGVRLDGSDKSIYAVLCPIGKSYTDIRII